MTATRSKPAPRGARRSRAEMAARTREHIILAAEQLFADRGIGAPSLREIAQSAGQGNTNAVQYHFQTKEQLVYAIFEYRVTQMEGPREEMLRQAEAEHCLSDARTLLEILCLPYLLLADARGRHSYAAFLSEYLTRHRPIGVRHPADDDTALTTTLRRVLDLLVKRISYLPPEIALSRIGLCNLMFLNMLVRHDTERLSGVEKLPLPDLVRDTLDIMALSLTVQTSPGALRWRVHDGRIERIPSSARA